MKMGIRLLGSLFWDINSLYLVEFLAIVAGVLASFYGYNPKGSGIDLSSGSIDLGFSFYNHLMFQISYGIFNIYKIFILILGASGVFLFSIFISKNKFSVLYLMGYKKWEIITSYFILFLLYSLFLLIVSFILISYIEFLAIGYKLLFYFFIFTIANLMFYLSTGFLIAILTKNSLIPGASIIILFYIAIPSTYLKATNTLSFGVFNLINYYLSYGFTYIAVEAIIVEILLSLFFVILSIFIANYRSMKVIR